MMMLLMLMPLMLLLPLLLIMLRCFFEIRVDRVLRSIFPWETPLEALLVGKKRGDCAALFHVRSRMLLLMMTLLLTLLLLMMMIRVLTLIDR